jgi:hypothetical protein
MKQVLCHVRNILFYKDKMYGPGAAPQSSCKGVRRPQLLAAVMGLTLIPIAVRHMPASIAGAPHISAYV